MSVAAQVSTRAGVAERVSAAARLAAAAGLFEGLGHVSSRLEDGGFAITSTAPLGSATAEQVIFVEELPAPNEHPPELPLETPVHEAIYRARPDVAAIVRAHSPWAVVVGIGGAIPPVTHGLGGLAGEIAFHDDPQLIVDRDRGEAAARSLGAADCLILRSNGTLAVAESPQLALVRAWFLEERARIWLAAGRPEAMAPAELTTRAEFYPAEASRVWRWLEWRFGDQGRR